MGNRVEVSLRCIGPKAGHQLARCGKRYKGQEGWDFVCIQSYGTLLLYPSLTVQMLIPPYLTIAKGWVCPGCKRWFREFFGCPELPKPVRKAQN